VLSLPFAMRYLLATQPEIITKVLGSALNLNVHFHLLVLDTRGFIAETDPTHVFVVSGAPRGAAGVGAGSTGS
jgi:hypothetical protein